MAARSGQSTRSDRGVRVGDVVTLGRHRLMCGDAGDPKHVARLFAGAVPDLVFTSPPYLQQRAYGQAIGCWDTLMHRVFGAMPHHERTQVLVNLGLVHRDGEWMPYWDGWLAWMRAHGWRRFGWYVWHKGEAMPGNRNGRLNPSFEFLFHINRTAIQANKTVRCKHAGKHHVTTKTFLAGGWKKAGGFRTADKRISNSVLTIAPEKTNRTGHPAVFPVALPVAIHAAYSQPDGIVYDPFAGAATSILAAEQGGRTCYAMEMHPPYVDAAVERWHRAQGKAAAPPKRPRRRAAAQVVAPAQASLW